MSWDIWLIIIASFYVGIELSHSRLSCSYDRHRFRGRPANSCSEFYRVPFSTSSLARFRDCGLLRLHLIVLSHMLPCELHMPPYCRWISRFSAQSRAHFCFIFILFNKVFNFITQFDNWNCFLKVCCFGRRGTRLNIRTFWVRPIHRHPVCLADILYGYRLSFDMRQ
jgi:hypothetical protein